MEETRYIISKLPLLQRVERALSPSQYEEYLNQISPEKLVCLIESIPNSKHYFGMNELPKRIADVIDATSLSKEEKLLLTAQVFNEIYLYIN